MIFELNGANAPMYLQQHHNIDALSVTELGGGVSNAVLRVEPSTGPPFVMKQSLGRLRVEQDWFSDRERIHRECDAIRFLNEDLPAGSVPAILLEDRENCIYAMSSAPADARPWKSILMEGECDPVTVRQVANLLASMIRVSRQDARYKQRFDDLRVFDQLRLDAYYRTTASRNADLGSFFARLLADTQGRDFSLVHGDWSPKNLLVAGDNVMAIDFEVVHYADPAFDAGFLINHLLLKSLYLSVDYRPQALAFFRIVADTVAADWFETAAIQHLAGLMLSRVDGKSPAEYIDTPELKTKVRSLARGLILDPPRTLAATMERL